LPACPYCGLFSFQEQDSFFFGREVFTDQLLEAVEARSLVAVVGPSGSGKSSVVLAGLLPHLRQAAGLRGAQGRAWMIVDCRPGTDPFYSLASALLPLLETGISETDQLLETRKLSSALARREIPLSDVVRRLLKKNPENGRLLLVIDQFEELYTLCQQVESRNRYIEVFLSPESNAGINSILTLRRFPAQALSYGPFADAPQNSDIAGTHEPLELGRLRTPLAREPASAVLSSAS
jgi:hypothetical protein